MDLTSELAPDPDRRTPAPRGAALITGAGQRIGRRLALACADLGYNVAVHHRGGREAADETVAMVDAHGRRAVRLHADLTAPSAAAALIARAGATLGPVTLLINNASLFEDDRLGELDEAGWDAHFAANLRAPVFLTQAFAAQVPAELEDGAALVVNILDQRVLKPNPQFFSYTLSKSALWSATRTAAQALAPRIRVNGIGPGPTLASIHQAGDAFDREVAAVPLARGSSPDDIACALAYLVDARAVTGQMLAVDGGQHLAWRTPDILED